MLPKIKTFLYDIQKACKSLEAFLENKTFEDYIQDELLRSAVERKLMIIGEAVFQIKRLDDNIEQMIPDARQIIGFRNVLVHGYFAVEDETVWGIIMSDITVLSQITSRLLEADNQS